MDEETKSAINDWLLENDLGSLQLRSVELLSGGRSNITYQGWIDDTSSVIIRVAPSSADLKRVEREFQILDGLQRAELPTPAVYGLCDELEVIGGYFFVMEKLPGKHPGAIDWATHPEPTQDLWRSLGHHLARVHSVNLEGVGLGEFWRPGAYAGRQISTWQKQLASLETSMASEVMRLGDSLKERMPESRLPPSLLHGDYKAENVLIEPATLDASAILDWELASFGDPMADLAWLRIWSPGQSDGRIWIEPPVSQVHDLGDSNAAVEAYAEVKEVDHSSLEFHEVFSYWKLSAINMLTEKRFIGGEMTGKHIDISRLRQQVKWQSDVVKQWALSKES